jgi:hypothetical protein
VLPFPTKKKHQSDYLSAGNPTCHKKKGRKNYEIAHIFMAILFQIMAVFWIFTPYSVLCLLRFGGTYCFLLQGD